MATWGLCLCFLLQIYIAIAATTAPYNATDRFLLNCGSSSSSTSPDGRNWDGDSRSKLAQSNMADISSAADASEQVPAVARVPFMTARIFHSQFSYIFPVSAGPKFLRLYFYPSFYPGLLNKTESFFSVTANGYTLLSNFSAFLTVSNSSRPYLIREYLINVMDDHRVLNLTFIPSSTSKAFVNGIEVVSVPNNFYIRGPDNPIKLAGQINFFYIGNDTFLETAYRLNVGGKVVGVSDDTGMFRGWSQDDEYVFNEAATFLPSLDIPIQYTPATPAYTAPTIVYTTSRTLNNFSSSLAWIFPVDSGFYYLLRLHFCEIQQEITQENQRVFDISINNQTVQPLSDVIQWSGGRGIPVFKDYVAWVPDLDGRRSKHDLWLSMRPNLETHSEYANVLLNGLEIFRLNNSVGSLAVPNPEKENAGVPTSSEALPENRKGKGSSAVAAAIGGAVGGVALVSIILGFLIFRRRRRVKDSDTTSVPDKLRFVPASTSSMSTKTTTTVSSTLPSDLCRYFSLEEIKSATGNFDDNFIIGAGGFGNVYRGYIDNGATAVAIKRLNPSSLQGAREFQTEIEMLSKLRHLHLVSLIGYCDDNGEMILVYDYMACGTLRDHLYKTENSPLPWKKRLQICIGAAKGLHYLHTGAKHTIIHRDIKSTNILLDEKWVAKVSDFGLSKIGPLDGINTHVSTVVKGSLGYIDPEYYRRQQLTEKSDVYSFGIVLFEVLCNRPAIFLNLPKERVNLAEWARQSYRKGTVEQIVDPNLKGQIAAECLRKYTEIAYNCVKDQGIDRPAMSDVVWSLEFALQLQETAESRGQVMVDSGEYLESTSFPLALHGKSTRTDFEDTFYDSKSKEAKAIPKSSETSTASSDKLQSGSIFSQIMNSEGR